MGKNPPTSTGDRGWIPGLGRSPGEGNGNPLQYSCLENPMDRGAWGSPRDHKEWDMNKCINNNSSNHIKDLRNKQN